MATEQRSNKWAFLIYQESAPDDYIDVLEEIHVPYVLSPWHDKDINKKKGKKWYLRITFTLLSNQ